MISNVLNSVHFTAIFFVNLIVEICIITIIIFVVLNFLDRSNDISRAQREKRSIVETGTMTLFFCVVYGLLYFRIGSFPKTHIILVLIGIMVMIIGTGFNVCGRRSLGSNWANHVRIYNDHTIVTSGPYRFVRHPLYASLIWMSYASGIIYANWAVIFVTSVVFVPLMYYRAKQEEKYLGAKFQKYQEYQRTTGMFLPLVKIFFS